MIDGSLHPLESVVNFRVDEKLKFHTKIPGGFYDASFFIGINEAKWKKLSQADRDAIMKVSGPALTKRWGARFDQENKTAEAKMRNDKHTFNEPSKALMERITVVRNAMLKDWATKNTRPGQRKGSSGLLRQAVQGLRQSRNPTP